MDSSAEVEAVEEAKVAVVVAQDNFYKIRNTLRNRTLRLCKKPIIIIMMTIIKAWAR